MRATCRLRTAARPARTPTNGPSPYSWVNEAGPSSGKSGPLSGRAVAIKDNISYTEAPTTCSSDILDGYRPPSNATCVTSLLASGADIVGQTKMDEFGMGSQTTHLPASYTAVHNPASPDEPRSAGGSSGGSAAAVAEGSCWAALGTDTGGSVRLPASYCGVVGLKPSYGMISRSVMSLPRYGVVSYADSLDCVGILARTIDAIRQVFGGVVSHPDDKDMTCVSRESRAREQPAPSSGEDGRLDGLRIGIPIQTHLPEPFIQLPRPLLQRLRDRGAVLRAVDLSSLDYTLPAYYVLASAEASSNLARFGGGWFGSRQERETQEHREESGEDRRRRVRTEGFGTEVKKRILAGTHALSADEFNNTYLKALHLRRSLRDELSRTFRIPHPLSSIQAPTDGIDLLLHPTSTQVAPLLSASTDGRTEYLQDLLTVPASLAGLPSMSIPAGKRDGLPVGVSLTGQWGSEETVFRAGEAIEQWAQEADRQV